MPKKLNSITDVLRLSVGDTLLDAAEPENAKTYTIKNIADGIIYAVHESGHLDLKVFSADNFSGNEWWLVDYPS
ncbi:MAG TPA: hypothetical protein VG890_12840 [Puia sp.]|nr:hypothetical protein [Puia sp.]